MKNLKFTIWLFALLMIGWTTKAQVSAYSFASSAGTYTEITGGTVVVDGTLVAGLDSWASTAITIPAFTFNGVSYTTAYVTSNGILTLGGVAPGFSTSTGISSTTGSGIAICPFSADLDKVNADANTEIRWQTVGNEVIFQWKQFKRYGQTESFDLQVKLNTVNGAVVFVYQLNSGPGSGTGAQPQVGIRTSTTDYRNLSVTSTTGTWDAPISGTSNSASCRFTSTSTAKSFTSGQTYTWTPPTCFTPSAILLSAISSSTATISWTAASPAPSNGYQYEIRTSGAAGSGATGLVTSGDINAGIVTANITGLSATTAYSFYVRSFCGGTDYSNWTSAFTFSTPCNAVNVPYNEGFESITIANTLPACMTASPSPGASSKNRTYIASATTTNSALSAKTGSKFVAVYYSPSASGGYYFSAPLNLTGGVTYTSSVFYKTDATAWTDATIYYGSNPTTGAMTNIIAAVPNAQSTTYATLSGTFTPATTGVYYVSFRGYNATSSPNYIAFDDFSVIETPVCVSPTAQPTTLVLTPSAGSISGSYTASASADSYLVLRTTDATPTIAPVNNTTYTVGSTLGNATIVKAGAGTSFASTALIGETTYYFHVYAMNSVCDNGPKYFTTTPLSDSSVPLLSAPATFTATATSTTNINLVSTGNVDNNNVIIAWNTVNTFGTLTGTYTNGDAITGGGTVIYQGAAGTFAHTPLTPGTAYYYKVWSKVGSNYSATGLTANATTVFSLPYTQNFNASPVTPLGWTTDMLVSSTHGNASNGLYKNLYSSTPTSYATSPLVQITANPCRLKFDYRYMAYSSYPANALTLGAIDKLEVQVSTDLGITYSTIYTINSGNHVTSTSFANTVIDLGTTYANQPIKVKLLATWGAADYYLDIDNFVVEEIPSCGYPSALTTGTITTTTAVLNWVAPTEGTPTGYSWIVVARGAGSAATPVASGTTTSALTALASPLASGTEYDFFVKTACGATFSAWTGSIGFVTVCAPITAPTTMQDFSTFTGSAPNPVCWSEATGALTASTTLSTTTSKWTNATGFANTGTNPAVKINLYGTSVDWIISNQIDLGATPGQYRVKYKYAVTYYNATLPQSSLETHKVQVVVSTDGGATWSSTNVIKTYTGAGTYSNTGVNDAITLSGYSGVVKIAFVATTSNTSPDIDFHIDNFVVETLPSCIEPTAINVTNITPTGATFSWTAPATGTPVSYTWKVVASGAVPTATAIATGTVASPILTASTTALTANTPYTLYIKSTCGGSNESEWSSAVNFATTQVAANLPFNEGFETGLSSWSVINGTQTNKWVAGTSTFNTGAQAAYISNNGTTNSYDITSTSVAHIYRDIIFPAGNPTDLSFSWKGQGEGSSDFLKVYILPLTIIPIAGSQIDSRYQIGATKYNLQDTWQNASFMLPDSLVGNTYRLVFTWKNDGSIGTQPPATIDDISIIQQLCGTPGSLTASNITSNSANISWNSISTAFSIEYKKTADATWTIVTDDASPYLLGSLDPNTSYNVRVRSFCDPVYSNYSSTITFTTNCNAQSIPITQNFDGVTTPAIPDCWKKIASTSASLYTTTTNNSLPNSLYMSNSSDIINPLILVSPEIIENLNTTQVKFYAKSFTAGTPIIVGTMTDPSNPATFTAFQSFNLNSTFTQYECLLNTYAGTDKYIAFKHGGSQTYTSIYVDDILIEALPACIKPTNVVASNLTPTSATINWTNGFNETDWEVQYIRVNYDLDWSSLAVTVKPVVLTLSDAAEYNVRVRAVCDAVNGVYSAWSNVVNFTTPCFLVNTFPLVESFDGATFAPNCWKNVNNGTVNPTSKWDRVTVGTYPICDPHTGTGMARFNSFAGSHNAGTKAILVTPGMNFLATGGYTVKFWMYRDAGFNSNADRVDVYYNTASNTIGATNLGTINRAMGLTPIVTTDGWYPYEFALPTGAGGEGYVIFEAVSAYGNNMFIDDVKIKQPSNAKEVLTYTIPNQVGNSVIDGTAGTVNVTMPFGTDKTALIPTFTISEFAEVTPASLVSQDFTSSIPYTVTAENGSTKIWTVTVNNLLPSTAAEITSLTIPGQVGTTEIISASGTINVHMPYLTDPDGLVPTIEISALASINPASGIAQLFSSAIVYTVTAEDVTVTKPWTVNVIVDPASQATDILTFTFAEQTGPATIDNVNHTVHIEVTAGTNRNGLLPTITVSPFAGINPLTGVPQNFTASVTYNVTAQDVSVVQPWTVTVTEAPYVLVKWDFPNTPDDAIADGGIAANLSKTIGAMGTTGLITYTAGVFTQSISTSGWVNGMDSKYWQVDFTTQGYKNISLSSVQRSSGTGPRNFKVQYKIGTSGIWTDAPGTQITSIADFTTGVLPETILPTETFNKADVFVRWIMTSNTSAGGGTIAGAGTNRIDDIIVRGVPMMAGAEITSFTTNLTQSGPATINSATATVTVNFPNGTNISSVIPTIGISAMAAINPATGVTQDLTSAVTYTVTAEDGTQKAWTVNAIVDATPTYLVTVIADNGSVTGAGLYEAAASVTLTATPNEGYEFVNWTEGATELSATTPYTFTMPANALNLTANFAAINYTVSITNNPVAAGTVVGDGTYNFGNSVLVTANPASGYNFVNWTNGGTEVSTDLTYNFTMPSNNVNLVANYVIVDYTIALTSTPVLGGTTTGSGVYHYNDNVTLTATPAMGYEFIDWTSGFGTSVDNPFIFTMPASDITGTANFGKINYTLTASSNPVIGGTVTGNNPTYNYNDVVSLVAAPQIGYDFLNWTINGVQVSTDLAYTFNMPANNVTIVANFITTGTPTYELSLVVSPANSGNVIGAGTYLDATIVNVSATPVAGFTFVSWTEGANLLSSNASFAYTMTAANTTLVANFAAINYSVSVAINPALSGSVTGEGTTYHVGDLVNLTATPAEGYEFINWTDVIGIVSTTNTHTFSMPATNVALTANFALVNYTVTSSTLPLTAGTNTGNASYTFGQAVTMTTTPNPGYTFVNWALGATVVATTTTYTFNMPSNNVTLVANYTANDYTVAVAIDPVGSGIVTGTGTTYHVGDEVTLTATPEAGYTFVSWTNTSGVVSTASPLIFNMAAADVSLTANFAAINYTVTTNVAPVGAGTVTGASTQIVGNSVTVTATPNAGYTFTNWSDAVGVVSTNASYTFNMPAANVVLTANFTAINYSVSATVAPVGSGTTTGAANYTVGQTVTMVATANAGYTFVNWTDANGVVSTNATYAFTMPAANVALTAHFVAIDYTVTVNVAPVSSGTTTGAGTYNVGASVTLTATPATGYSFVNWTEGTTELSATTPYIFTMPATNKTITANFAVITYPLTLQVSPVAAGTVSGAGSYAAGTAVTVSTTPASANFIFVNWTNGTTIVSTTASFSYTMPSSATTLVANYQDVTSINENNNNGISVYPNPSNGAFNLVVDKAYDMQVVDVTGRLVISQKVEAGLSTLHMEQYNVGIYFIRLISASDIKTIRIVKQQ